MATVTIDASTPATGSLATLLRALDNILKEADNHQRPIGADEYQVINELRFAVTTGAKSTNAVSQIVITYS